MRSLRSVLPGWQVKGFGMVPAVVLGQDLAQVAGLVGDGALADLAARDRQVGDGYREAAGTGSIHHLYDASTPE